MQTVNDKQNLVIDPLSVVPEVFELQRRPADDVALAETCGILEQERIDVLVVAVAFALCNNLVNQLLRSVEGCQLCAKLVDEIVRFALMVEKFLHTLNNAVAAEFLLGTRTDQPACFVLVLLFLNFLAVLLDRNGLVGVGHEVVIENFFLYHLLGVKRAHSFLEAHSRVGLRIGNGRKRFEYLLDYRTEGGYRDCSLLKTALQIVEELTGVSENESIVDVRGYEVY